MSRLIQAGGPFWAFRAVIAAGLALFISSAGAEVSCHEALLSSSVSTGMSEASKAYVQLVSYALNSDLESSLKRDVMSKIEASDEPLDPLFKAFGVKAQQISTGFSKLLGDQGRFETIKIEWNKVKSEIEKLTQQLAVEQSDRDQREDETRILFIPRLHLVDHIEKANSRVLPAEALHRSIDGRVFSVLVDLAPGEEKYKIDLFEHIGDRLEKRSTLPIDGYPSSRPKWHVDAKGRSLLTFGSDQGDIYLYHLQDGKLLLLETVNNAELLWETVNDANVLTSGLVGYNTSSGEIYFAGASQSAIYIYKLSGNRLWLFDRSKFESSRADDDPVWINDQEGKIFVVSSLMHHTPALFEFNPSRAGLRYFFGLFRSPIVPIYTSWHRNSYKFSDRYVDANGNEFLATMSEGIHLYVENFRENKMNVIDHFGLVHPGATKPVWLRSSKGRNFIAFANYRHQFLNVLEFKNNRIFRVYDVQLNSTSSDLSDLAHPVWHESGDGRVFIASPCSNNSVCIYELLNEQKLDKVGVVSLKHTIVHAPNWLEFASGRIYLTVTDKSGSFYKVALFDEVEKSMGRQ